MNRENRVPDLRRETRLWTQGYRSIAGLDEAGRGAWAGPVVAAAVILPADTPALLQHLSAVRDSKMLRPAQRQALLDVIRRHAVAMGVGVVPSTEIDRIGIVPATRAAMTLALQHLGRPADYLLIDHLALPHIDLPQFSLPKGDAVVLSIACASIVAKVARDQMMIDLETQHPGYGFAQHKGYGTAQHRAALEALGPCPLHRLSFSPLRQRTCKGQG